MPKDKAQSFDAAGFGRAFQSVATVTLATLLLIAGIELTARTWYFFREPKVPVVLETNRTAAPGSLNASYETEDLDAFNADSAGLQRGFRWHPYVYWRRPAYDTPTVHVSKEGIRRTVQPYGPDAKTRIFLFGGSTMWGTGVRDEHTIASLFAQRLAQLGWSDFHVVNYGESAYVATQSLLTLLLELRAGNIPDIVVFYEGINEVASSHVMQRAGITQHETAIGFYENAPQRVEAMPPRTGNRNGATSIRRVG